MQLDELLLSSLLGLCGAEVKLEVEGLEKPIDHAPVSMEFG